MTESTPQRNRESIIRLEGRMGTFEAEVKGEAKATRESINRMEKNIESFVVHTRGLVDKLFTKSEDNQELGNEAKAKAAEAKSVGQEAKTGIKSLKWTLTVVFTLASLAIAAYKAFGG